MSHLQINLNPTLQRLQDEGYELEIRSGLLLVHSIPYVAADLSVKLGVLVSEMSQSTPGVLGVPSTHQIHFIGEQPYKANGAEFVQLKNSTGTFPLAEGVVAQHYFSHKPREGYPDYYVKIKTYAELLSNQARGIDSKASARTFKPIIVADDDNAFLYADTASSRAGIGAISSKLKPFRVAIVGLGGTGAYVMDLVAKTHVHEIHLYDGDIFNPHNAFRSPGAASIEQLNRKLSKVRYFHEMYSVMRNGIFMHEVMIHEENVWELAQYDYVFVCVDKGSVRRLIFEAMENSQTTLFDVGMGINATDDHLQLWGVCRVTTSTPKTRKQALARIPKVDRDDDIYASNIQVADLNCLNAVFAVEKWKRMCGFYLDDKSEFNMTFNIGLNQLSNEEPPE